MIVIPKVDMTT